MLREKVDFISRSTMHEEEKSWEYPSCLSICTCKHSLFHTNVIDEIDNKLQSLKSLFLSEDSWNDKAKFQYRGW